MNFLGMWEMECTSQNVIHNHSSLEVQISSKMERWNPFLILQAFLAQRQYGPSTLSCGTIGQKSSQSMLNYHNPKKKKRWVRPKPACECASGVCLAGPVRDEVGGDQWRPTDLIRCSSWGHPSVASFLEYYRMMGASGVTLYVMDSARDTNTRAVIDFYRSIHCGKPQ